MEKYVIADFCFVRTPAFPVNLLNRLYLADNTSPEFISNELKNIFANEAIQAALHGSSSMEFYSEFKKWINGSKSPKESEKIEETLVRYLARMTTRCVPFGLFSGFSIAELAGKTGFELDDRTRNISHLRLDMEYIQDIVYTLMADEEIRRKVKYYKNSSIYRINEKFKYIEYTTDTYKRMYNYAAVGYEEYLESLLCAAEKGATFQQLIGTLKSYDEDLSEEEAGEYIDQLIKSQLLVSELEPNVTGKDNLTQIVEILNHCDKNGKYTAVLEKVLMMIQDKNYNSEKTEKIRNMVEEVVGVKPYWSILQTDLQISTKENNMSQGVLETISHQVQDLSPFAYGMERPALNLFKKEFQERYDTQEVPMVEAIDPDIGIGYGNLGVHASTTLLKDIFFGQEAAGEPVKVTYDGLTDFATAKYVESLRNRSVVVKITDSDLKQLREQGLDKKLPENFFIHGSLVAESQEELDKGNFLFHLKNLSGPPSCLTIGRFCYTSDYLNEKVKSCIKIEETLNKDAVYAEIVHLTDARAGNVIIRPHLRKYEIPYIGKSGLDPDHQIPITDIMVSIKNNNIRLRSKKLDKEIIPRLTNAHVFSESYLPIYKFLGDSQRSNGSDWLSWHWQYLKDQKFLPRVQYKNIVLKTAKWLLLKEDLPALPELNSNNLVSYFKQIAEGLSIPRHVSFFEDLDKEFIFDLNSELSCRFILKQLHKIGKILLEEYFQPQDHCWIRDIHNCAYPNEIMLPVNKIITDNTVSPDLNITTRPAAEILHRKFIPGSEWVYFKLYTSMLFAETILTDYLYDFVQKMQDEKHLLSWHFLRYGDPDYHLRVRFKLSKNRAAYPNIMESISPVLHALQEQKLIHRIQVDTYDRELERYGSKTMEESEEIFSIDSSACLSFIKLTENYEEINERWLWAVKAIDMFLDSFGYSIADRQRLLSKMEKFELIRSNGNKGTIKQANAKYKSFEKEIRNILSKEYDAGQVTELLQAGCSLLDERSIKLKSILPVILDKINRFGELQTDDLAGSYIHMFINRLFVSNPNKCEFVIYTLLNRYYLAGIKSKVKQS